MANDIFSVKIGGMAGQGVKAAGLLLAKMATRSGYQIYTYIEYPSLIRGGHNNIQINISSRGVTAPRQTSDFLMALNQDTIDRHGENLPAGAGILFDTDGNINVPKSEKNISVFPVPLAKLAKDSGGQELLENTVAVGATLFLLSGNLKILQEVIRDEFAGKEDDVLSANLKAAEAGFTFAQKNFSGKEKKILASKESARPVVVNGNEAVALGAIAGGLQFAAIYPMSPISDILHALAAYQEKFNYIYKQPEDEISAINMCLGAAFAGARALTATSGGGFCLMTESLGLAAMTETPVVIVEGMRGGPATGLPTWSEQGDLQFALHAHQGDFSRIVLAAGDAREAFNLTRQALNLADYYQTPVILLIDKNICDHSQSFANLEDGNFEFYRGKYTTMPNADFQRYALSDDGISPRTVPGTGNFFLANSDEHNPVGFSSEEISDRRAQTEKRMRKLATCAVRDMMAPELFGDPEGETTIVSWGSCKGSILEALKTLKNVNYLHLTWLSPFPTEAVKERLAKAKRVVLVEANFTGQLGNLITEKTGIQIENRILKYDGRPFFPEEIAEKIKSL